MVSQALYEFCYFEILWSHALNGGDGAMQDVIEAVILPRPFDGEDVQRFFNDADQGSVSMSITADGTWAHFRDVETLRAGHDLLLKLSHRFR
jgi:hypothetical protein